MARNKLRAAQVFFADALKWIRSIKGAVPDHLLGVSDEKTKEYREVITRIGNELTTLVANSMSKISRSEDEVSQRLEKLFDKAHMPLPEQMNRARDRKERGNPPGKPEDPLGDQITWEIFLEHCRGRKQLWIITEDHDYFTQHDKRKLLNSLLHRDLIRACGKEVEIRLFADLDRGIIDFSQNIGLKAEELLTEQEEKETRHELEALPQFISAKDNYIFGVPPNRAAAVMAAINSAWYSDRNEPGGGGFTGHSGVPLPLRGEE